MEKEEWRDGLKKCYKFVKVCSTCRREYGTDNNKMDNGTCPICENKINNIKGRFGQ